MEILDQVRARQAPGRTTVVLEESSTANIVGACVVVMTGHPYLPGMPYIEAIGTALAYHGCALSDELTMLSSAQLQVGLEVVALHTPTGPMPPISAFVRPENRPSHRMFTSRGFQYDGLPVRLREGKPLSRIEPPAYIGLEVV
jgi:hypothetical protein